jgi:N-formylglutamate amidohydrolase
MKPLFASIPHSGERVPPETPWLAALPERLLMFDVDRYVDRLYQPVLARLGIPFARADWHRYAVDLNRWENDIDADSVADATSPSGSFARGLHWSITTTGEKLMPGPMTRSAHDAIVRLYFAPFHAEIRTALEALRARGATATYHLDLHSMPSVGTREHADPGERRADVVISDCEGRSCAPEFKDLAISAYSAAGFRVAYNWPYKGGRLTQAYGRPELRQNALQVELNRALYMDEQSKQLRTDRLAPTQAALEQAIAAVYDALPSAGF